MQKCHRKPTKCHKEMSTVWQRHLHNMWIIRRHFLFLPHFSSIIVIVLLNKVLSINAKLILHILYWNYPILYITAKYPPTTNFHEVIELLKARFKFLYFETSIINKTFFGCSWLMFLFESDGTDHYHSVMYHIQVLAILKGNPAIVASLAKVVSFP